MDADAHNEANETESFTYVHAHRQAGMDAYRHTYIQGYSYRECTDDNRVLALILFLNPYIGKEYKLVFNKNLFTQGAKVRMSNAV